MEQAQETTTQMSLANQILMTVQEPSSIRATVTRMAQTPDEELSSIEKYVFHTLFNEMNLFFGNGLNYMPDRIETTADLVHDIKNTFIDFKTDDEGTTVKQRVGRQFMAHCALGAVNLNTKSANRNIVEYSDADHEPHRAILKQFFDKNKQDTVDQTDMSETGLTVTDIVAKSGDVAEEYLYEMVERGLINEPSLLYNDTQFRLSGFGTNLANHFFQKKSDKSAPAA